MHGTSVSPIYSALLVAGLLLPPLLLGIPLQIPPPSASLHLSIPYWEQLVLFVAAFIVKPLYMTLSLVIALLLRHRTDVELVAVRRGMVLFFLGELACAVNYLIYNDNSPLVEYCHNLGMVAAFALFAYSFMEALDTRVVRYSAPEKRCAMLALCGGCYKQGSMRCTLLTLFYALLPALALLAAMPLTALVENRFVGGTILGEPVTFGHPLVSQITEVRLFPVVAIFFLMLAFAVLRVRRENGFDCAKALAALGIGALLFSLMRFAGYWGYAGNPLWADVWEELTECLFILLILKIVLMARAHNRKPAEEP